MSEQPVDDAARQEAIYAEGSVLVQAPAGSGKTTLLAQRYLRLLAAADAPERILALTFTRRAAQEMRERVLHVLRAAATDRPGSMSPQTWELGVAARRRMALLGIDLERHPSRLRIETIDAFNAWLAAQLPITAGAGSRLNLTDTPGPLYEEAARRALAHDEHDHFGRSVDRVLAQADQRWDDLVALISKLLPGRDRWLPLIAGRLRATELDEDQLRGIRRRLDEDLQLLVVRTLNKAREVFGEERLQVLSNLMNAAAGRLESPSASQTAWRADASTLRADVGDVARWHGVAATLLTKEGTWRRKLTKQEGFPQKCADKPAMLDLLAEFERHAPTLHMLCEIRTLPSASYDDDQWARVREVAQVLVLAAAQLEQVFRERARADFPAVSMAAMRALGSDAAPTDLALRLDYRLQHIMIDEFQDTSSAQLELLKLLTAGWQRGDGRSVFCVGDPMQSIYGFRQAEVRAFLELADEGIGDVPFLALHLRSNFRSARPLVEWINRCFSRILPRFDDRDRGAIAFRPSESERRGAAASAVVTLRGFASRRDEAEAVAAAVAEQSARHPEWRIAILVRARSHARDIAASLRARALRFRAIEMEPLQDRPMVRDLVMLICALLHLGDRRAWFALLRAPWVGLTLADLLHLARSAPTLWEALASDAALSALTEDGRARCTRIRGTLDAAFRVRNHGDLARWVERTWLALGGASCAAGAQDLEHAGAVFARLRRLDEQGLPDAADLAAAFDDLNAEHSGTSPLEIMTIHKAKGLEFDMVVVPGLDRQIPQHTDELLLSVQFARAGRDGMVLAARPAVGAEADDLFEFLRYQTRDAAQLEAERLLYVACTRAKWQLHLTATIQPAANPRSGTLLAVLWPVVGAEFSPPTAPVAAASPDQPPRGGPLHRVPRDWKPSMDAHGPGVDEPALPTTVREESPVFDWAGETARRVGILVHAELQAMDIDSCDEAAIRARDAHFRRWLSLHGVPADRLPQAAAWVGEALVAVHGDPRGRWILRSGHRDDVREHALSGEWQGNVIRVVFDRSFIDAEGVRWIIDYKTSRHTGGLIEEFLDREVERYRPQLHRYAQIARKLGPEPVRVGLYFPLMRAWREWTP